MNSCDNEIDGDGTFNDSDVCAGAMGHRDAEPCFEARAVRVRHASAAREARHPTRRLPMCGAAPYPIARRRGTANLTAIAVQSVKIGTIIEAENAAKRTSTGT